MIWLYGLCRVVTVANQDSKTITTATFLSKCAQASKSGTTVRGSSSEFSSRDVELAWTVLFKHISHISQHLSAQQAVLSTIKQHTNMRRRVDRDDDGSEGNESVLQGAWEPKVGTQSIPLRQRTIDQIKRCLFVYVANRFQGCTTLAAFLSFFFLSFLVPFLLSSNLLLSWHGCFRLLLFFK